MALVEEECWREACRAPACQALWLLEVHKALASLCVLAAAKGTGQAVAVGSGLAEHWGRVRSQLQSVVL